MLLAMLLVVPSLVFPTSMRAQESTPVSGWGAAWPMSADFLATTPEFSEQRPAEYEIDVSLDMENGVIAGTMQVTFINHTGQSLSELPFRLYPNAAYYLEGSLAVQNVLVDGVDTGWEMAVDDTVLFVEFASPLQPGDEIEVAVDFTTRVPVNSTGSFGILSHDFERKTWILTDWYPIVAGWDVDTGWGLDPPTIWGDPTFSDTSLYTASITVPAGMSVVATGRETRAASSGTEDQFLVVTGPVRELALVLDDGFDEHRIVRDGVEIALYMDVATSDMDASLLLDQVGLTLDTLSGLIAEYPYDELDIVQTELAGALGVSWSGVVFVDEETLFRDMPFVGEPDGLLTFLLTHELGHQWWGGLLGVNSNDHAFMNESLANYASVLAYASMFDHDAAMVLLEERIAMPYLVYLTESADGVVDRPVGEVGDMIEFGRLIYGKGGLGLHAIWLQIGNDAFVAALQEYAEEFAFGIGSPADLLSAFERTSGQDLGELWNHWFESAETTYAEVEELLTA